LILHYFAILDKLFIVLYTKDLYTKDSAPYGLVVKSLLSLFRKIKRNSLPHSHICVISSVVKNVVKNDKQGRERLPIFFVREWRNWQTHWT
jgi:hypothetical protein